MSIVIYIALIFYLAVFSVFIALFFVLAFDSLLRGHDSPTSRRAIRYLVKAILRYGSGATTFYDLGCGRGTVVLAIKKEVPRLEVYGIDNSAIRIFFAKLKAILRGREIIFEKQNIFQTDLRDADIVYAYLWYDLMPSLEAKLQKELKPGAMVITNTSSFPNWKPVQEVITYPKIPKTPNFETLFIYVKTK